MGVDARSGSVGIMSMQRIFNYGSSLQAYALGRLVETVSTGANISFLDFAPGPSLISADPAVADATGSLQRTLRKLLAYNDVEATLRDKIRFLNHKRRYAAKYFPLLGIPSLPNREFNVDVQLIGSDEVFNCVQANTNVGFSRELFGHASPARRVASYAGSFGNTTLSKIEAAGVREQLAEDFSRFAAISVRDQNSADIVYELVGRAPEIHLDPTLVYDFAEIQSRIPAARPHARKYVIVYGYSGRFGSTENHAIREYARRIGARVLAFGGLQASADEYIDCDPFTLLAYFRDAEAVVTDTFHGSIFSIINEVPFATLIRPSTGHGYGNQEKLGYLLDVLGLSDRALSGVDQLGQLIETPIDYTSVRAIRDQERSRSLSYLSAVLSAPLEEAH